MIGDEGGFRYMLEGGIHHNNAHHGHANTIALIPGGQQP